MSAGSGESGARVAHVTHVEAGSLRANTVTWLALSGLTLASYLVSDSLARAAVPPILAVAATKCALVGLRFMRLRAAHPLLRAGFLLLVGAVVAALFVAQRSG